MEEEIVLLFREKGPTSLSSRGKVKFSIIKSSTLLGTYANDQEVHKMLKEKVFLFTVA